MHTNSEKLWEMVAVSEAEPLPISESVDASLHTPFLSATLYSCSIGLILAGSFGVGSGDAVDKRQTDEAAPSSSDGGCVAVWLGAMSQPVLATDSLDR